MRCSKTIGGAAFLLLMAPLALADTHVPGGFVSGTWTLGGSPYILDGNVVVHQDSTLTIEPGVDVLMDPFRRLRIEGQILAVGTDSDSIRFIATDTTEGSEGVDFYNTNISPRDSSKLVYCEIKYGVASPAPDPYMHGGGLYIKNSSRLLVSHCCISHCRSRDVVGTNGANGQNGVPYGEAGQAGENASSGHGGAIFCENSSPNFIFNSISKNRTGNAWAGNGGNGGMGTDYTGGDAYGGPGGVGGSAYTGQGGAVYLYNSNPLLVANLIFQNSTGNAHGGSGGNGGRAYSVVLPGIPSGGYGGHGGNGNSGSGGAVYDALSHNVIINNLILQNFAGNGLGGNGGNGGSVPLYYGYPGSGGNGGDGTGGDGFAVFSTATSADTMVFCTFAGQNSLSLGQGGDGGQAGNGGAYAASGSGHSGSNVIAASVLSVFNSIIWNNVAPTISSTATATYSCIQGGFPGVGNISTDPLFVTTPQGDYLLSQIAAGQTQQSPCVDGGNPASPMVTGTTRTDGVQDAGVVDMGYHYPLFMVTSPVSITLTPYGTPIIIPSSGGSFNYNIAAANGGSTQVIADVWCMVTLPNGSPYGPVLGPVALTMPPGYANNRDRTQSVPASAPSGNYVYHGYIGDYPAKWDSSSFTFDKRGAGDVVGEIGNWVNTGESFANEDVSFITHHSSLITSCSPNPFNAQTTIRYDLPYISHVQLAVYDVRGRMVADLVDGVRSAGVQELTFDAANLPSGMYFYRLQANGHSEVRKLILLK